MHGGDKLRNERRGEKWVYILYNQRGRVALGVMIGDREIRRRRNCTSTGGIYWCYKSWEVDAMVESVMIIISCYVFSALLVHAAYGSLPHVRGAAQHYVLVTKNNEQQAELVMRAITWHAWLFGKETRVSVIDENSDDQTIPIIGRLSHEGQVQLWRTRNWAETERMVRSFKKSAKVAGMQVGSGNVQKDARADRAKEQTEAVTVIYVDRSEDRVKLPLFR